jgi:hypothetical protein
MGKRGAEKELTQNNWQENEDDSNSEVSRERDLIRKRVSTHQPILAQGGSGDFKKASGNQLEGRK